MTRFVRLSLALPLALALACLLLPPAHGGPAAITLKLLAVNDLHGGLDTGRMVAGRPVGGAAFLAAHLKARAVGHPHVRVVGAGDMVGAAPPVSALLREEPTIRAMNEMGFLVNAPGNHEFDRGIDEFFRLSNGGCHPETGCLEPARFKQISANIVVEATGQPLLPPYHVEDVGGVPVAFIGATHTGVRTSVAKGAVDGLAFPPAAAAINRYVPELQALGIRTIVVLIHEGGALDRASGRLVGPITRTVEELDPEVDVVVSAHTHQGYATRHAGKLVTQGFAYSTAFVDIDLTIDLATRDVLEAKAEVVNTYNERLEPDPVVRAIVERAEASIGPRVNRVVGTAARRLSNEFTRTGEIELGNLLADAYRWKTGAQIAMTNAGGIRTSLEAGQVTWGALFSIQPFSNELVTMTLTGAQLQTLFSQQWTIQPDGTERYRPLQLSGLTYAWDGTRPMGDRIVRLELPDGRPIDRAAPYRVTVNSFMAGGGDAYAVLTEGTERVSGIVDVDALVEYVEQLGRPIEGGLEGRITRLD